jgi:hypothetical protein
MKCRYWARNDLPVFKNGLNNLRKRKGGKEKKLAENGC